MDRFIDGGMAPALQSSNHQSTGLTSEGREVNQAESTLLHKKVNGKTYKVTSRLEDKTTESSVRNITLHPSDAEAAAHDKINPDSEVDSCLSSELKETAPEVTMPTLHIGQGDSVIGHIANYNGWGESKKSVADGILQESNNLSAVRLGGKTTIPKISALEATDAGESLDISCNGDSENRPSNESSVKSNGHIADQQTPIIESTGSPFQDTWQDGCKAEISDAHFPTNSCVSNSNLRQEQANSKVLDIENKTQTDKWQSLLPAGTSDSTLRTEIHGTSENGTSTDRQSIPLKLECEHTSSTTECTTSAGSSVKPVNQNQNSSDDNITEQNLTHTLESSDGMFNFPQILPGDLTGMNMSDNLTNTLQELAASLKGASFPLKLDVTREIVSREATNTVNTDNVIVDTLRSSAKSLDFCEDDCTERETRILERTKHAAHCAGILEHRLGLLRQNLLKFRSKMLRKHIHEQLVTIASHLPRQDWEGHPVNVVDTDSTSTADLWQKILENDLDTPSKSVFDRVSVQDLENKSKKLQSDNDHKTNPDPAETAGDSASQSVHSHSSKLPSTAELREVAQDGVGVLKKELHYAKSCCDPDITESSSDEDFEEAYEVVSRRTKTNLKVNSKPRITRYRKSFCRWVAERAEISRKWTWLQSRIAGMEFQIRNQGDLYNQLRSNKGMVRLVPEGIENNDSVEKSSSDTDEVQEHLCSVEVRTSASSPPCSINHVLDNVNHQASRLMDKLSPISGGWPSPVQEMKTSSDSSASVSDVQTAAPSCRNLSSSEVEDECARTIALDRSLFKTRKLVRINQKCLDQSNSLKPATVPNDSSIMCSDQPRSGCRTIENYSSLVLKAAVHDHSYHATISSLKDIPLSVSIQAVMKSKHKWCKKSDPSKKDKTKKVTKKVMKSEKKLRRSLNANHLEEVVERKRRRLASQLSEVSTRKRTAGSMDSDLDSHVVIGGFNAHQFTQGSASGTSTPTSEMFASSQNNWKKKKATEQTFDINNIVIPHGLTTPRIEKLVYKEIQTPSWKFLNVASPDVEQKNEDELPAEDPEDISDGIFHHRHENYEISEKKKFMSLVQSRRSRRGLRNSTTRESTSHDPASPVPVSGESEAQSRVPDASQNMSSLQPNSTMSPAKPGSVRRLSGDHNAGDQQPTSPHTLPMSQRNLDTSYGSCPSPATPLCPNDPPGSRRNSHDNPAPMQRTLSCNANKPDEATCDGWDVRSFPLCEDDMKLLDDVEHAKTMLRGSGHNGTMYKSLDGDDSGRNSNYRALNLDRNFQDYTKLSLSDFPRDSIKSTARRRTDSRGSSLASFDDSARHSDASSTSVSSSRRKKKGWHVASDVSSHRNDNMSGKASKKLTSRKSKHKYIHVRLSETDDSSTDSEGDSSDSSYTSDDAGHLIDDFADPEWEAPRPRERR